jgi:hypothetical protein
VEHVLVEGDRHGDSHPDGNPEPACDDRGMTETPQPTSASLSAKIIRACTVHMTCPLTCQERQVEDLGEIASFSDANPKEVLRV